jgi:6-phosphogluconate dehydrogenase
VIYERRHLRGSSPALTSALTYFDAYRQGRGTANLIQAQRDFFGAHGWSPPSNAIAVVLADWEQISW